ncbi:MAG: transcriptional repressor [Bacilli bacterium]
MRYSVQREKILEFVTKSSEHPTADIVYKNLRREMPNLSLGTVYRNLTSLARIGKIKKITVANGSDHYDKTLENHYHILCNKCKKLYDIYFNDTVDIEKVSDLEKSINNENGCKISNIDIMFYGICNKCLSKERM